MANTIQTLYSQQSQLEPLLKKQEKKRKEILGNLIFYLILVVLGTAIAATTAYYFFQKGLVLANVTAFGLLLGIAACVANAKSDNRKIYKKEIMPLLLDTLIHKNQTQVSDKIAYKPDFNENIDFFDSNPLFSNGNRLSTEDLVYGKLDKTLFSFYEAHYWYHTSGKNSHNETCFRGMVFVADFNKNFSGVTTISKGKPDSLSIFFKSELEKIKLEAGEFSSRFDVYATNGQEARYIITPAFMERFVHLEKSTRKIRNSSIGVVFRNSQMEIYLPTKHNYFEPTLLRALKPSDLSEDFEVMEVLLSLVGIMQLNTRIWSKE